MIYDCFSFYNELDLLEIRLNVLKDVVDKFVLAEATVTHTGQPKSLCYEENKSRFAEFADRIIHIVVDDFPKPPEGYTLRQASWMRENWQRNGLARGLLDLKPDDMVLISDIDEIPSPEAIGQALQCNGVVQFNQLFANFYVNYINYIRPFWFGTKALRYSKFTDDATYSKMKSTEYVDENINKLPTLTKVRFLEPNVVINHAGWHFSYLGGADAVLSKARSIAHVEYVNDQTNSVEFIKSMIDSGQDVTGCGYRFFAVPLDYRFPAYLLKNQMRFSRLILTPEKSYFRATRFVRIRCWFRGWIRRTGAKLIPRALKPLLFEIYCKLSKNPIKT